MNLKPKHILILIMMFFVCFGPQTAIMAQEYHEHGGPYYVSWSFEIIMLCMGLGLYVMLAVMPVVIDLEKTISITGGRDKMLSDKVSETSDT